MGPKNGQGLSRNKWILPTKMTDQLQHLCRTNFILKWITIHIKWFIFKYIIKIKYVG